MRSKTLLGSSDSSTSVAVVDEGPDTARHADPAAVGGAEVLVDEVEHLLVELGEDAQVVEVAERARALGDEHVGGGALALLLDEQGEVGGVEVPDVDLDAVGLGEGVQQGLDEVLRAAGVDREDLVARRGRGRGAVLAGGRGVTGRRAAAARGEADEDEGRRGGREGAGGAAHVEAPWGGREGPGGPRREHYMRFA